MSKKPSPKKNRWRQFVTLAIEVSTFAVALERLYEVVARHTGLG